jgi:Glycosyltransferase family 87
MLGDSARRRVTVYLSVMLFLHAFLAWRSWRGVVIGLPDFSIFYTAGEILGEGRGSELYDDRLQEEVQRSFSPIGLEKRGAILPYNHPPFEALVFVPLARLPYVFAYLFWLAINLGLTLTLLVLLRRNFTNLGRAPLYLWLLAGFGFLPIFIALIQGQDSIFVLFCYGMGYLAFRRLTEARAGGWLGLGLCKFHLVLPFVFPLLLLRRQRFLAGFFLVGAVLALLGLAAVGWRASLNYPLYVWAEEKNVSYVWNSSTGNAANLRGIVESLCPSSEPRLRICLILLFSAFLVAGVTYAWRRALVTGVNREWVFALSLVATVLLSYHIYVHDLSILFLAALIVLEALLSGQVIDSWARGILWGYIGVLFCGPMYLMLDRHKQSQWLACFLLILFVILLVEFFRIQPTAEERRIFVPTNHNKTGALL